MKRTTKIWLTVIALAVIVVLGILVIPSTGIPSGKALLHYEGTSFELTKDEASRVQLIFLFKNYNDGIGGCPFQQDISISIGDTVYAIALDGCHCIKNWQKDKCFELSDTEFQQIADLFKKYCGDTLIY